MLSLAMPQSFPFFMQLASNTQHTRGIHTPFSRSLPTAYSSVGSLLPIPVSLTNKVTEIVAHPFRTNTVFPAALCELLRNSTLRAVGFPFSSQNCILGLNEYFVAPPDKFQSKQVQETKQVVAKRKCLLPSTWAWAF